MAQKHCGGIVSTERSHIRVRGGRLLLEGAAPNEADLGSPV